ncbi:unnamed protein product [Brassica oleracea var. botrytis]|uniref:(rape) hypothetical protein n=1 Tax=Brassica napus TaxID=3708 RepID=A0A816IBY1_BRANA|nr:unnamed protein product [Brassica napus]
MKKPTGYQSKLEPQSRSGKRDHQRYEEKLKSDDAVVRWFAPKNTDSIAFHQDRIHPSNKTPYRSNGSEDGQPSGRDKTKAILGACSRIIAPKNLLKLMRPSSHRENDFAIIGEEQAAEQATSPTPHHLRRGISSNQSQSTTTNETLCAITTRERSGGSSKKQRKPARNQIPNTTRRFVHHRTNQKKNEADLVLEGAAPLPRSEKQVYVTGKLPRTPKPDQEQQRRRKSRPQASPYTESLDLRRGKRLPPPRTTKKTGER